jgi:hypothetical protein
MRIVSSVAYADEEMLSEAKTARPTFFETRSVCSRSVAIARPGRAARSPAPSRRSRQVCAGTPAGA